MSYRYPREHRCSKCDFECKYGPDDPFPAPILSEGPVCPQCYANFLRDHCGVMVDKKDAASPERGSLPGAATRNFYR